MPAENNIFPVDSSKLLKELPGRYLFLKPDAPDFTIILATRSYLEATHTSHIQVEGLKLFELFPASHDNQEVVRESLMNAISTKCASTIKQMRYDIVNPASDQFESHFWTAVTTPVLNEAGEVKMLIHSVENITERIKLEMAEKEARQALIFQKKLLYDTFMQAPVAIGIFSGRNFVVELANPFLCELYGRTEEELLNRPIFSVLTEAAGQGFEQLVEKVVQTGKPFIGIETPVSLRRSEMLETVYVNFVYEPWKDDDGRVVGIIAIAVDVSEQVKNRKHIEESESRLNLAIESSNMGTWEWDLNAGIFRFSLRYVQMFGFDGALHNFDFERLLKRVHAEDRTLVKKALEDVFHRPSLRVQCRVQSLSGQYRWIQIMGKLQPSYDQGARRLSGTIIDITEQKLLEKQREDFVSVVSHELKTPITSLKIYCQLLERQLVDNGQEEGAALFGKMNRQIVKLTSLIEDLLDVTKLENGRLPIKKAKVPINSIVNDTVEEVQRTSPDHKINVNDQIGALVVDADRERISQVLINLLSNAIKYSPPGSDVFLRVSQKGEDVIFSVQDEGVGIPVSKQKNIFQRFYRVSNEQTTTYPGLGLGLYISAEIVNRHGGRIWFESEPGRGSVFYFTVPIHF